jgi:F0F1-type ATP synthase delta subunit
MAHEQHDFELPLAVVTVVDASRLRRELSEIDEFILQNSVRQAGTQPALPKTSHNLEETATKNGLNLLQAADRKQLAQQLDSLKKTAPILHMSFAADPSVAFQKKLITWLRNNIHPQLLLQIGLQPSIAAGCVIRTRNKYLDLSLRKHFDKNRQILLDKLAEITA